MDSTTVKSELTEAFQRKTAATADHNISEMRPCYGGSQAATVWPTTDVPDDLIAKGQLKWDTIGAGWPKGSTCSSATSVGCTDMERLNVKRQAEVRIVGIAARKGTSRKSAQTKSTVCCAINGDTLQARVDARSLEVH